MSKAKIWYPICSLVCAAITGLLWGIRANCYDLEMIPFICIALCVIMLELSYGNGKAFAKINLASKKAKNIVLRSYLWLLGFILVSIAIAFGASILGRIIGIELDKLSPGTNMCARMVRSDLIVMTFFGVVLQIPAFIAIGLTIKKSKKSEK